MAAPESLREQDYSDAAQALGCDIAAIKAVAEVESSGHGFLDDGRLRILFEGHQFYRYTQGAYAQTHPTICYQKWCSDFYCKGTPEVRGVGELARLEEARKLDERAALMSCSIGKFQVMGFNFPLCGFQTVEDFWDALAKGEGEQLKAFCSYVKATGLDVPLKQHDWAEFARRYNGPEYRKNQYDTKLARAYSRYAVPAT